MSEAFLEEILKAGGLEALCFIILNNLAHVIEKHVRSNMLENNQYGDLKK